MSTRLKKKQKKERLSKLPLRVGNVVRESLFYIKEEAREIIRERNGSWKSFSIGLLLVYILSKIVFLLVKAVMKIVEWAVSIVVGGIVFFVMVDVLLKMLEGGIIAV